MKLIIGNQTTKIVIGGKDNLHGDLFSLLREYMSVKVDGSYHIMQAARKKGDKFKWDGKHYFITASGSFATGFLPMVVAFLKPYNLSVDIEDTRNNLPIFKRDRDYSNPFFTLAQHQIDLIESVYNILPIGDVRLYFPRGIWKAATNAGKTAVFGVLVKNMVNAKGLLLVDSQELFAQHIDYYTAIFGRIGIIGNITPEGKKTPKYVQDISPEYPLTIAMVATLAARLKKDLNLAKYLAKNVNILGVDECHYFANSTALEVIQKVNAGVRIFMSGTPLSSSDKMKKLKLVGMSATVLHEVTKKYLMDNGYSMIPIIKIFRNRGTACASYEEEFMRNVLRSENRANIVAQLLNNRPNKKCLVTFWEKAHGFLMYDTFITKYPQYADCTAWVYGNDPERARKIADYISGKIRILFTSTILRQGINVKDIQTIIHCMGTKNEIALSQFMGRGERLDGINKTFEWIGFFDEGKYLEKHSLAQLKFYRLEGLKYTLKYEHDKSGKPIKK